MLAAVAVHGQTGVVAIGGDPAPDGNGKLFDFDIPSMNSSGEVVVVAALGETTGGNNDNTVILTGTTTPGSLTVIVRKGDPSPDGNGNFFTLDANSEPVINDAGHVAFIAGLSGTFGGGLDETGIFGWGGAPAALKLILRQGTALPGGIVGITVPNLRGGGVTTFSFDELGRVVFGLVGFGIFRGVDGTISDIARSLQAIPGGPGLFTNLLVPALNDGGTVGFADGLQGIFRGDGTMTTSIARTGDPAPGGNGTLAVPFFNPAINNQGDVAFFANLSGTSGSTNDNQGVFIRKGDALSTIVRRGQNAPDGNGRFLDLSTIDDVAINETGQVAFLATLTATAGGSSDNSGLFRGDGTTLKQIVRLGDRAPDGSRISTLSRPALNDLGQVAFLAGLVPSGGGPTPHAILLYDDQRGLLQAVRTGDPLAGSRIALAANLIFQPSVTFNGKKRSGLNQQSQIVFRFDLDDGRRGIGIANPLTDSRTATPTPTSTATPSVPISPSATIALPACVGDCDQSHMVAVNELVRGVNIALSAAALDSCPAFDCHGNGRVPVDCLVTAVNAALRGCP